MKKLLTSLLMITTISSCAYVGFGIGIPLNGNSATNIKNTKNSEIVLKKNS